MARGIGGTKLRSDASADRAARRPATLTVEQIAWLAVPLTAAIALVAIAALGPPLGRLLLGSQGIEFWPSWTIIFRPEPSEQGRYLVAAAVPLAFTAFTALGVRLELRLRPVVPAVTRGASQLALLALVVACVAAQRSFEFGPEYSLRPWVTFHTVYFTPATLVAAGAITLVFLWLLRDAGRRRRLAHLARASRPSRLLASLAAVAAVVVWLLHAATTEDSVGALHIEVREHLQFPLDETFAVLNGRTPLVDFVSQYGFLWAYAFAAGMSVLGKSVGVYVTLALVATGVAMLALFAVLRRVTRSPLIGLLLFLPVLATSFFMLDGPLENRYTYGNYFGTFPIRYAGPFVLCWLTARHLDARWPRPPWILFCAAGLVALNNVDAGIPALGATLAALLWTLDRRPAALARLVASLVLGLAAAYGLVSVLTLTRTGSLPDLALLVQFSRLFGATGFGMMPMPVLGIHVVLYLTFVAAIGAATVDLLGRSPNRLLSGLLVWSGVFGLGAGAYYVGRSHPENLPAVFPIWALSLALLLVASLRPLFRGGQRRPGVAALACIFGFAVAACSLAQTPTPWSQVDRLRAGGDPVLEHPVGQAFIDRNTDVGEPVLILSDLGHRAASNLGIENVSPYAGSLSMPTPVQLDRAMHALQAAGGRKVFLDPQYTFADVQEGIMAAGFELVLRDATSNVTMWTKVR